MHLVRSACLRAYEPVARAAGLDPFRQLRDVGINREALGNPDLMIDADAVRRLLEDSARLSGQPDFGLRMADLGRISNLGPLALVMREEPTIRKALECLARYLRLHNEGLLLRFEDADDVVIIHVGLFLPRPAPARQGLELSVGVLSRILSLFLGPNWQPESVCFSHGRPTALGMYHRIFGPHVEFGRDFDGIVCRRRDLEASITTADPMIARAVKRQLDALLALADDGTAEKVRKLALMLLPAGQCNADAVARHLGVDRRTVHRRLAAQDTTFSGVVDGVRVEMAQRHLHSANRPLTDIAELLGFSELSAFSRWFQKRFGCSASIWRAEHSGRQAKDDWVI